MKNTAFQLHAQLSGDCTVLGYFPLCMVLLMNDANYPWFILVPQCQDMSEIHELSDADQLQLLHESVLFSRVLEQTFHPDKLNIAALGNVVPQLHIHHIVRYQDDAAWPNPVWGIVPALAYEQQEREALIGRLLAQMPESFVPSAKLTV